MNTELARRAVACKHWRWMPGMLTFSARIDFISDTDAPGEYDLGHACGHLSSMDELPELTDPATLGCLLHLVREAWGDNLMVTGWRNTQTSSTNKAPRPAWRVSPGALAIVPGTPTHAMSMAQHRTEAEALVAALEAAP